MPAAGATDADRKVALSLGPVLRNQELQQGLQPRQELLRLHPLQHPGRDPRVGAGMGLQALDEIRVGQETDVEHQIARGRDPVAEPEAEQGQVELVVLSGAAELRRDDVAQLVHVHARGVDDLIGEGPELRQHAALQGDSFLHAPVGAEGVPPPRLREPSHQRIVGAVEEHHLQLVVLAPHLLQGGRCGVEEPPLPRVDYDRELRLRSGPTEMTGNETSMSCILYVRSSTPNRSYCNLYIHSTSTATIYTVFRSRTAETPKRSFMLMMPMPRITMW